MKIVKDNGHREQPSYKDIRHHSTTGAIYCLLCLISCFVERHASMITSSSSINRVATALTQCVESPAIRTLDLSAAGTERLIDFGNSQRQTYISNAPFPHIVIDNLFDNALLEDVLQDVTHLAHPIAKNFYGSIKKFATPDPQVMGPTARRLLLDLCSSRFCLFLEALTGIEGIIPDPHFEGGGVHEMAQDGFLKMHTDFNWNNKLKLDRRLNMLIYLNQGWQDSWGGHLELWDSNMKNQFVKVLPAFNTTVIFSTTDYSYHGLPNPLVCPADERRRSLALYYYSNGRPKSEVLFPQSTGTNYRERPGEFFHPQQRSQNSQKATKSNSLRKAKKKASKVDELKRSLKQSIKKAVPNQIKRMIKR